MSIFKNYQSIIQRAATKAAVRALSNTLGGRGGLAASVVIATRNKATYLDLTLEALERQIFPSYAWEVIVMDDASDDNTSAVLDKFEKQRRLPVMRRRNAQPRGAVATRNKALQAARGEVVIFMGDDHLIGTDFLMQHLKRHLDNPCIVVGDSHRHIHTHLLSFADLLPEGTSPAPVFAAIELLDHPQQLTHLVFAGGNNLRPLFQPTAKGLPHAMVWAGFSTNNTSMLRDQVLVAGGFDESLRDWGLADADLSYRLHRAGLPFHFEPHALSLGQVCPGRSVPKADIGCSLHHFFCKHPNLNRAEVEPMLLGKCFARA